MKQINIWIVLPAIFDRELRKSKSLVARHYSAVFFLSKESQNNIGQREEEIQFCRTKHTFYLFPLYRINKSLFSA